jgi:hypothetical protein
MEPNNIFDIYPDTNYGPTTAVRPRLVNGAIDYTANDSRFNSNQFTILETSQIWTKRKIYFC